MAAISACFLLVTMASSAPPAIGDIPHFPAILYVKPVVGLNEQIFGVNEQISGRGQERLIDISLKVMCEKQRTSTFSHHRRVKRLSLIRSAN
jgi:hypothetical protein